MVNVVYILNAVGLIMTASGRFLKLHCLGQQPHFPTGDGVCIPGSPIAKHSPHKSAAFFILTTFCDISVLSLSFPVKVSLTKVAEEGGGKKKMSRGFMFNTTFSQNRHLLNH